MLKTFVSLALLTMAVGYGGCASADQRHEADVPNAGVTGGTLKRAAVQNPDSLDFGADVQTVEAYDLNASAAGMSHEVGSADTQRDQEIDEILNTIGEESKAPLARPPVPKVQPAMQASPPVRRPAVPPLPKAGGSARAASGVTASVVKTAPVLLPLPASVPSTAATEEALAMAARQDRLFPRPLWRRVLAQKRANDGPSARGY